ncbi:chromosome partitioning protein ParA [Vibrio paucivorans]
MNKQTEIEEHDDDVVVIEERDKRTHIYIALAGVLGLALGGLGGSMMTANKWETTYNKLEEKYQTVQQDKKQLVVEVEEKVAKVDHQLELKLQKALEEKDEEYQENLAKMEAQVKELETAKSNLEAQITEQKDQLAQESAQNSRLNRQADMQATMLERSRELFQRELKIKQELASLEKEREDLLPKIEALKKQCDVYLEGTSWDAKSDSCDKQDEANSRISQIDQMIQVHRMDLKQIESLSEDIGL